MALSPKEVKETRTWGPGVSDYDKLESTINRSLQDGYDPDSAEPFTIDMVTAELGAVFEMVRRFEKAGWKVEIDGPFLIFKE